MKNMFRTLALLMVSLLAVCMIGCDMEEYSKGIEVKTKFSRWSILYFAAVGGYLLFKVITSLHKFTKSSKTRRVELSTTRMAKRQYPPPEV